MTNPVKMILFCPNCFFQHIDAVTPDWSNPPHRSHLCAGCGYIWRPADVATEGVSSIETAGRNDGYPLLIYGRELLKQILSGNRLAKERFEVAAKQSKSLNWRSVNILQDNVEATIGTIEQRLSNPLPWPKT